MDLWYRVTLVEFCIALAGVAAGRLLFKLDWRSTLLAVLMVTPVPLFRATAGTAGFIYVADFVALGYLVSTVAGRREALPKAGGGLVGLAIGALVLLPLMSTGLGWLTDPAARNWKFVALGMMRGVGYVAILHMFIRHGMSATKIGGMAAVQILMFAAISACGIFQYARGIDLDYWNKILFQAEATVRYSDYGGGFMGLYRGAVGAWAIGMLALIPLVATTQRGMTWTMSVCIALILGGVLAVGSRQGAVIGMIGLMVSYVGLVGEGTRGDRLWLLVKAGLGMGAVILVVVFAWNSYAPDKLQNFVEARFQGLSEWSTATDLTEKRMAALPIAWRHIVGSPQMVLVGAGYGGEDYLPNYDAASPIRVIEMDSEFMYVWQLGGIVLIIAYGFMLFRIRCLLGGTMGSATLNEQSFVRAARVVLYTGILLLYGHFFILNVHATEAPIAYWIWSIFGLGVGIGLRTPAEYAVGADTEYTVSDEIPAMAQ